MKQSLPFWFCLLVGLLFVACSIYSSWYLIPAMLCFVAAYGNFQKP